MKIVLWVIIVLGAIFMTSCIERKPPVRTSYSYKEAQSLVITGKAAFTKDSVIVEDVIWPRKLPVLKKGDKLYYPTINRSTISARGYITYDLLEETE